MRLEFLLGDACQLDSAYCFALPVLALTSLPAPCIAARLVVLRGQVGALRMCVLHCRVGLRPYSRSGPIIGPAENCSNLFIATGHEGSGLTLAPASAAIVASMVLDDSVPQIAQDFYPETVLAVHGSQ